MRARHRHLNSKDAGAVLVLDSRYITGLNNNDALSSWSDRSGNGYNMAQASSGNQPLFKTDQIAGQPVVTFDGSNDYLSVSQALDWTAFVLVVRTSTTLINKTILGSAGTGDIGSHYIKIGNPTRTTAWDNYGSGTVTATGGVMTSGVGQVFSGSKSTTQIKVGLNGVYGTQVTYTAFSSTNISPTYLGAGYFGFPVNYFPGDVALVIGITSTTRPPDSLMKRLHHHAAYSFKIACS